MHKKTKIKGHPNLIRHPQTGAILNSNKEEIKRFQHQRSLEERLNNVEESLRDITDLLKILAEKNR